MATADFRYELRCELDFDSICDLVFQLTGTSFADAAGCPGVREAHSYDGWTYRLSPAEPNQPSAPPFRYIFDAVAVDRPPHDNARTVREFPDWCATVFPRENIVINRLA